MEGPYRHAVYFEWPGLDGGARRRIQNYFRVRRKSSGGDCGSVVNISDRLCAIFFTEREAQQRVLQRFEHTLEFASGPVVLTVRSSPEPHSSVTTSSPDQSVTPTLDLPSSSQQQPVLATSLTPSGEEYELRPDTFLLRYLSEHPGAWHELQRELATVACSAQIYPEEGRVLVRTAAQPQVADTARNWKSEVDKLFDGYLCHYEVDAHKARALLRPCSSHQTTEEVQVYSEAGMAVVVGKRSQVNGRLTNLEVSTVKHPEATLTKKQSSIHRLGEAKLRLLWKEISQRLGQDFPGVKVSQGDSGQLVLEGSMEEVLLAVDLVSDMENLVLKRTVSDMSPHFLSFLKKACGGPGVLRDFLGLGEDVEIELQDTELHFFSFSDDKLNDAQIKLQEKFKAVRLDVPNWPALLSKLREKLKSKTNEMNQGQCRAQAVFISDSTVCLLGHSREVEELSEAVTQIILDHSNIESKVILRFPELSQRLPELLQLHNFDYSGVLFHHLNSSSGPMLVLEGPSSKVTDVNNRLGPFLASTVQSRVTIDLPGAVRYYESSCGRETFLSVAQYHKCLIQLVEQPRTSTQSGAFSTRLNSGSSTVCSYSLRDRLQVLVCQGDITKVDADALVNAANEKLDHCGGVAAALSKAAGPEVQKESKALVKQIGKIPTGDVVVTTGGNLKCKKLLHAVGPIGGTAGGRERFLLEKTVRAALNVAEKMALKSVALPCISSGVFGVPATVCSEAIVTAVKDFGSQGGRSLSKIILIDTRGEVVRAMHEACDRILQGSSTGNGPPSDVGIQRGAAAQGPARGATAGAPEDGVHVEVTEGTIETQQVDALVSPMVGHEPLSTRVGNHLYNLAGPQLTAKFHAEAGGATRPGDTVVVQGSPALQSKAVIFLNLIAWDNKQDGAAVQVLRQGLRTILASCETRGFTSLAFPVLGTGAVLRFPHSVASSVVLEEVNLFDQNRASRSPFLVRVVIHPNDKESSKAFQSAQETLHLRGFTNDANPDQASFYRHVSVHKNEVTAMLGGVRLQMVYGDIINELTDVIVNTTDFSKIHSGVSKAILTAAGPTVKTVLAQVGIPPDNMCTTGPGLLHCKEIIHARFKRDPSLFLKNCKKILTQCESKGFRSVSFPAVNTGVAGMDSAKACKAMLDGLAAAITELKPHSLSMIRIVILKQQVFQAFKSELNNCFGLMAPSSLSLREKALQRLKKWQEKYSPTSRSSVPDDKALTSTKPQPAVVNVICCGQDTISAIKRDLEDIVQKQLVERELEVYDFLKLDAMELEAVMAKVRVLGLSLEQKSRQSAESVNGNRARNTARAESRARSGSEDEVFVLKGLKEDVLSVSELVNKSVKKTLCVDLQEKEEAVLALMVQWSVQDLEGVWQELSLRDNFMLEDAFLKRHVFVDITAPNGATVSANLKAREATDCLTGLTYKLKQAKTDTTLELPSRWEPMQDEVFKKIELQSNSEEYQLVAQGFLNTAKYNIQKIERVQNLYLWHAYSVCKQRILAKNGPGHVGERRLYHGTSAASCDCIERDRFDRSYAGAHAAAYGKGVYFAVQADYSARTYSTADASGLKRLYVACVLTGHYTVGNSSVKAPPSRGADPTDCFDSLVNNLQQPTMFVIFHDDQAYPEYLITFK